MGTAPSAVQRGANPGGRRTHQSCNLNDVIPATSSIRSLFLNGPAGRLEALLNAGAPDATYAAVVCHPHPMFGGTLHNKVVFHTMKALNSFGFPVLRFNFRGTGLSEGEHDHGGGEVEDVRTSLDWLDTAFHLPLLFAGFSFGAAVRSREYIPMTTCATAQNPSFSLAAPAISSGRERNWRRWLLRCRSRRSWSLLKLGIISSKDGCANCGRRSKSG